MNTRHQQWPETPQAFVTREGTLFWPASIVAIAPTAIEYTAGKIFVVSGNFTTFPPTASGVVAVINPATMAVLALCKPAARTRVMSQ